MRTKTIVGWAAVGFATSLLAASPALAQADPNAARYVAANCANCHGTAGIARDTMPSIAGQKKEYIAEQMRAFRDGKRPATVMHQIAKGYSDAQIDAMADYFARQPAAR